MEKKEQVEKDLVEVIEILRPCRSLEDNDESVIGVDMQGRRYKRVALLSRGYPLYLEQDSILERRFISTQEHENLSARLLAL